MLGFLSTILLATICVAMGNPNSKQAGDQITVHLDTEIELLCHVTITSVNSTKSFQRYNK